MGISVSVHARRRTTAFVGMASLVLGFAAGTAEPAGATVTAVTGGTAALSVAHALAAPQTTITSASWIGLQSTATPNGVSDAALAGFPSSGSSSFGILTTGNVTNVPRTNMVGNTTLSTAAAPGRGNAAFDASVLKVDLSAPSGANCLTFDFKFLSEEYPFYVGSSYNDAFIAELDNTSWTTTGTTITAPKDFAFDTSGKVVSVNATGIGGLSAISGTGTEFNGATAYPASIGTTTGTAGGATGLLHASTQITPGAHSVYFSIFDNGDSNLDSAVFLHGLAVGFVPNPATNCVPGATPVNYQLGLLPATGTGTVGVAQSVTATLTTASGAPVSNAQVKFTAEGPNASTGTATTDASGNAVFSYVGAAYGTDQISACYQPSGATSCLALASASRTWTAPLSIIADNQTVTYGDPDPQFTYHATGLLGSDHLATAPTCGVAGPHAGAGTYLIVCSGAAAATGYVISYLAGTLTVSPASAAIVADNASQTYGQPTPHLTYTVSGLHSGDALIHDPTCSVPGDHSAAGAYRIVCAGADAGPNYRLSNTSGTLTVGAATVIVTPDSASIVYGDDEPAFTYTVRGLQNGEALTTEPTCGVSGDHSGAGTYTITCSGADAGADYAIQYPPATLTVGKRVGLVTADSQRVTYGDQDPAFTFTVTGLTNGDALTSAPACGVIAAHAEAGSYDITCSGGDAGANYTLQYAAGTLTVDKAALVVTADNQSRLYGASDPGFTSSVAGLVGDDRLTTEATCDVSDARAHVGSYPITCSGADAGDDYTISYAPGSLHVTPATVVITANGASRVYGTADPAFTYQVRGLLGTDNLVTPPVCGVTDPHQHVGTYEIACSGADAGGDYALSSSPGTLSITPATATVTADDQAITFGSTDPTFSDTVTGLVGDDLLRSPARCGVDGDHSSARTYSITCSEGDAGPDYLLAYVPGTFVVSPAIVTVTAEDRASTYGDGDPPFTATGAGFSGSDTFVTPARCDVAGAHRDAGTYAIACSGADAGPNYTIRYVSGVLSVQPAALIVQAGSASATYGDPAPTFDYTVSGLVGSDDLAASPTCGVDGPHTAAGTYAVTCAGADAGANYRVGYAPGTYSVGKATITVTSDSASIVYGDADPLFGYTVSGLVGSDTLQAASNCAVHGPHGQAGSYPVTCSGADAGSNYRVAYALGTLTVAKAVGLVTADSQTITYGDHDPSFTYTVSGVHAGDTLASAPTCGIAGQHADAGNYPIVCHGGDGGNNYELSYVSGTLTVRKAAVRVTAANQSTTYGNADPAFSYTVAGLVGNDQLSTGATCTVAGQHSNAGSYPITCSGADGGGNYTVAYAPGTLMVNKAAVTVTAPSPATTYGVKASSISFAPSLNGLAGSDTAASAGLTAVACSTTAKAVGAGSYPAGSFPVSCTGPVSVVNYTVSYAGGTLTVAKAVLTVVASDAARVYQGTDPAFTAAVSGFVNGDQAAIAYSGAPALHASATRASDAGTYPITATQGSLTSANYAFAFRPGTLTITKAAAKLNPGAVLVTLAAGGVTVRFGTLTASLTYGSPAQQAVGQTITFSVGGTALCSAVTDANGAATCQITAKQEAVVILHFGYTATFAGSADLLGTSAVGGLISFR
jgi:hypothetical protein